MILQEKEVADIDSWKSGVMSKLESVIRENVNLRFVIRTCTSRISSYTFIFSCSNGQFCKILKFHEFAQDKFNLYFDLKVTYLTL